MFVFVKKSLLPMEANSKSFTLKSYTDPRQSRFRQILRHQGGYYLPFYFQLLLDLCTRILWYNRLELGGRFCLGQSSDSNPHRPNDNVCYCWFYRTSHQKCTFCHNWEHTVKEQDQDTSGGSVCTSESLATSLHFPETLQNMWIVNSALVQL